MKMYLNFLVFILGAQICFAQEIVSSRIQKVTLFTDQALIERLANVKVKKGLNEIILRVDAFNMDRDSIQAKVFGEGELYSVQLKEVYLKEAPQEKVKNIEQKIKQLDGEKKSFLLGKDILNKKKLFLDSLIDFARQQVPKDLKTNFPKVNDLEGILTFLDKSLTEIDKEGMDIDLKIEEIDKELDVLRKELASLIRPVEKKMNVIEILFNSKKEQKVEIEANYLVSDCSWGPLYKIDIPLDLSNGDLIMMSKIKQKSGEDWEDVKLIISNVTPLRGARLPSLKSWFLDIKRFLRKETEGIVPQGMADSLKSDFFNEERKSEADFSYAQKKKLPLSFEYELPKLLNIESKDKETILPVFSKSFSGDFFYYSIPKVHPLTYFVCQSTFDKELLPGPINIYFGGRFVGKTYLSEKAPGEEFYLNLGAARRVNVVREKVKDKVKESFLGKIDRKTVIREMGFKISIENLKEESVKMKILDNIPVSNIDKIIVKDVKFNIEPTEKNYQNREGLCLWDLEVEPKSKKCLTMEFTITYPKGTSVYGL